MLQVTLHDNMTDDSSRRVSSVVLRGDSERNKALWKTRRRNSTKNEPTLNLRLLFFILKVSSHFSLNSFGFKSAALKKQLFSPPAGCVSSLHHFVVSVLHSQHNNTSQAQLWRGRLSRKTRYILCRCHSVFLKGLLAFCVSQNSFGLSF